MRNLLQHLPDNDFDMLVIDLDALQPVHLLYLVDQVLLHRVRALYSEDIGGIHGPSLSLSPANTRSPSRTLMCLPGGIRYSRSSPPSVVTSTRRMPRTILPNPTDPSTSLMTAGSLGLRASNNSATREGDP